MRRCFFVLLICGLLFPSISLASDSSVKNGIYIEVYYDVFLMRVWEKSQEGKRTWIGDYDVTLTWKRYQLPKKALIKNVEFDPIWRPTRGVKNRYLIQHGEALKDSYGPGEEKNAMGAFKWTLVFVDEPGFFKGDNGTRVHQAKDVSKIGKRDSSGCVRLKEEDGRFLTNLLWGRKDRVMVYTTLNSPINDYY